MAAPDITPHEPPIKTPRQLIIVVLLAFFVPVTLVALLATLAASGLKGVSGSLDDEAVARRIQPVAKVTVAAAASEAKGEKSGEQVVQATCAACHQTGAAGAPKIGDRGAWAPRIAKGLKEMLKDAVTGVRAMPPRGGNPELTDAEVERAIIFMANQSGANLKESGPAAAGDKKAAGSPREDKTAAAAPAEKAAK